MRAPFPGFVGPSYISQSLIADGEECINWCLERIESPGAQVPWALYPSPGVTTVYTSGQVFQEILPLPTAAIDGPIRGLLAVEDMSSGVATEFVIAIGGGYVYRFNAAGGVTRYGNPMAVDSSPATLCWNGPSANQVFITSGGHGYINTIFDLSPVTTQKVTYATHGGFLDGYFLALGNGTFQISDLFDGNTWDPTQVVMRETAYDPWVAMAVIHQDIWLFGRQTADIWYNAGTAPFPFAARPGGTVAAGIHAPFSLATLDDTLFWLGSSIAGGPIVYRAQGYTPTRVSTYALETAMAGYSTTSDAVGFGMQLDGHPYYVLTFPTADVTWVYDVSASAVAGFPVWTKWLYYDHDTGAYQAWRPVWHAYSGGVHYTGDRASGTIYSLSSSVATDVDGNGIRRLRRFPHLSANRLRQFFQRLELLLDAGLGVASGQGSDPQVMLRWSNDGGHTWSAELWTSAGAQGNYTARVFWERLGSARDRVFEVVVSDPIVAWRLLAAYLDAEPGIS